MTKENDEPLEGRIIEPSVAKSGEITPQEAIAALKDLVGLAGGIVSSFNEEITKRQQLRTREVTEVARIKNQAHKALFSAMDRALENGDNEAFGLAVTGIVDLAKHSSLAAAGDLSKLTTAFEDPDTIFET